MKDGDGSTTSDRAMRDLLWFVRVYGTGSRVMKLPNDGPVFMAIVSGVSDIFAGGSFIHVSVVAFSPFLKQKSKHIHNNDDSNSIVYRFVNLIYSKL